MRPIKDFPNYSVDDCGNVYSHRSRMFLKPQLSSKGYLLVDLQQDGKRRMSRVHRLVMEAYEGVSELAVNHIDGDKANNQLSNLEYVTNKQNSEHAVEAGLLPSKPVSLEHEGRIYNFYSQAEAARFLGVHSFKINDLVQGKIDNIEGWYLW